MPELNMEAEYNNRARVANAAEITQRWAAASVQSRRDLPGTRDIAYSTAPRQIYDFYPAAGFKGGTPLVVYIHGGYWQRGHGSDYAFIAREFLVRGVSVAIPSYTLCPETSVAGIVADMKLFVAKLWEQTRCRPVLVGHSAGGHLAAELMANGPITGCPDGRPLTA